MISRRFWPLVGGAETAMANLGSELASQGADVTLLTAQWRSQWPQQLFRRGVKVVRLPNPSYRWFGTWRYMTAISRWLRSHRERFDLVYVSMLKHDACAAVQAAGALSFPVVLRAEGGGTSGDVHWQQTANFGGRIARVCRRADAIVAPSAAISGELHQAAYPPERIHEIPNGVTISPPTDAQTRQDARATLAEIRADLDLAADAKLAVYTGRLHEAKGLEDLIRSFASVLRRHPQARLWLAGEGPQRAALAQQIQDQGLSSYVTLVGNFDSVEDLLAAADLFVLPSHEEGMSLALLEAMAHGLPIVTTRIAGNLPLITHDQHGWLVTPGDCQELAMGINRVLDDPQTATHWGQAARRRAVEEFSITRMAQEHLDLFHRLMADTPNETPS
jgi:glycosyltransferase involved in cell wall biosynthesis